MDVEASSRAVFWRERSSLLEMVLLLAKKRIEIMNGKSNSGSGAKDFVKRMDVELLEKGLISNLVEVIRDLTQKSHHGTDVPHTPTSGAHSPSPLMQLVLEQRQPPNACFTCATPPSYVLYGCQWFETPTCHEIGMARTDSFNADRVPAPPPNSNVNLHTGHVNTAPPTH